MKSSFWFRAAMIVALLLNSGPAFAAVTITTTSKTFAKEGGAASISTGGTGSWTATTDAAWISFNRASGEAGVSCVYVVSANYSADTRSAVIDIAGNVYTVTQTGYTAVISPESATADYTGKNGTITVTVDAGVAWTATPNCSWLSVSPSSGTSSGSVTYTVAAYSGGTTTRTGSITIAGKTFSVSQTGTDVTLSPESVVRDYAAGVFEVEVAALSSTSWTITPNASWISVVDPGYGYGNATVMIAVGENPSVAARTGTVEIGSKTLTVTQKGMVNPTLSITPTEAEASPLGAYGNVAVYATPDAAWTAESLSPWITISDGATGAGNGNIRYVAAANPTLFERTGRIKVTPPAVEPEVDYLAGLVVWCPNESGWDWASGRLRFTTNFNVRFNGTFKNELTGIPLDCPAYGFAFKVEELQAIHRLVSCGDQMIWIDADNYLVTSSGGRTSFRISKTGTYYQVLINGTTVWAGEQGMGELTPVGACDRLSTRGFVRFGRTESPSPGYLSGANVFGLAMWNRVLTDREATNLGITAFPKQDEIYPGNEGIVPVGAPSEIKYAKLTLGGNGLFSTNATLGSFQYGSDTADWFIENAVSAPDRFGLNSRALKVARDGFVTSKGSFAARFNNANQSYSFWCRFDSLPEEGETFPIFSLSKLTGLANCGFFQGGAPYYTHWYEGIPYTESPFTSYSYSWHYSRLPNSNGEYDDSTAGEIPDRVYELLLLSNGNLSFDSHEFEARLSTDGWHMITLIGRGCENVSLFVDGAEIGNYPSNYSIALTNECFSVQLRADKYTNTKNVEARFREDISFGGFDGVLDELTFFNDSLTAAQIRALYETGKPPIVYHTVTQGVIDPAVSPAEVSFAAAGGSTNVQVTVAANTQWTAESDASWITVTSSASSAGSARVSFDVAANPSTEARTGTLTLAGKAVTVSQSGLWSQISYDGTVFSETSDSGFIDVQVEGNGTWTASTDADWLTLLDDGGRGSGSVMFVVDDFNTTAASRTATVTIAGKTVFITQRGYQLSIDPAIAEIGSNAGAGEIGVSAPIGAVWEAIVSADWITLVGGSTGVGDGTLRYTVAENATGATRTGKIVISGQEYTLTQLCTLKLETSADGNGTVSGAGDYDTNESATLVATPAAGYAFTHWSGDAVGVEPTVTFTMDTSKKVTAHFIPEAAAERLAEEKAAQGGFYTREQIHAMELGNVLFDVDPATGKARIGVKLMETSSLSNPDWKPVSVTTQDLDIGADGSVGISAPATGNAKFFRVVSEAERP